MTSESTHLLITVISSAITAILGAAVMLLKTKKSFHVADTKAAQTGFELLVASMRARLAEVESQRQTSEEFCQKRINTLSEELMRLTKICQVQQEEIDTLMHKLRVLQLKLQESDVIKAEDLH